MAAQQLLGGAAHPVVEGRATFGTVEQLEDAVAKLALDELRERARRVGKVGEDFSGSPPVLGGDRLLADRAGTLERTA